MGKLIALIPSSNISHRKYIVGQIFEKYLGFSIDFVTSENYNKTVFILENGHTLEILDAFFEKKGNLFLIENIPEEVSNIENPFDANEKICCIYGYPSVSIKQNAIVCNVDILAGAFFMLTRWEEFVYSKRDLHQRFSAKSSLAYRHNFLHRPIVNEYILFAKLALRYLGFNGDFSKRNFEIIATCDVDYMRLWPNTYSILKTIFGSFFKDSPIERFKFNLELIIQRIKSTVDPWDTFSFMMKEAEKNGCKMHFFFLVGGTSKYDNHKNKDLGLMKVIIQNIVDNGHQIGFHPSYETFRDLDLFTLEYNTLQQISPRKISAGRQHYLRFQSPHTWRMWENLNLEWDSTVGYSDAIGFRCGICYPFNVYDFLEEREFRLEEKPLLLMDVTVASNPVTDGLTSQRDIELLIEKTIKYEGQFIFLWHNTSFNTFEWRHFQRLFSLILAKNRQ